MGFGGNFHGDPNVGPGSPKAQLIMHYLQHELWQNASNNALGEISQQQETCGAISFG